MAVKAIAAIAVSLSGAPDIIIKPSIKSSFPRSSSLGPVRVGNSGAEIGNALITSRALSISSGGKTSANILWRTWRAVGRH